VSHRARTVLGSALLSLVALAGPFVPLAAQAAAATPAPSASASPSAPGASATPGSPVPGSPVPGSTCAISELVSIAVPTPSPLPTHEPGRPTIGGELLAGNGLSVPIGSAPLPSALAATSWLVADLDSGAVLGACGAHRYAAPASVQKLLLVATALPKLNPTDVTTITDEDLNFEAGSSAVGLMRGGTYAVEDLFLGLMLNSGNDAANTLARLAGGTRGVPGGLADMNAEARRLGAWDTHAETPSGLDGPGQVTSVYDLALIFRTGSRSRTTTVSSTNTPARSAARQASPTSPDTRSSARPSATAAGWSSPCSAPRSARSVPGSRRPACSTGGSVSPATPRSGTWLCPVRRRS